MAGLAFYNELLSNISLLHSYHAKTWNSKYNIDTEYPFLGPDKNLQNNFEIKCHNFRAEVKMAVQCTDPMLGWYP